MISSQAPDKTAPKKTVCWDRIEVTPGSKHYGWLAGRCIGAWVHYVGKHSKPCKRVMSEGRLQCQYCLPGVEPTWRGYVPVYDQDYARRFVCIGKSHYEVVSEIRHLDQIEITKGKKPTHPVVVRGHHWRTATIPDTNERRTPVDLMNFLVATLWGDQELARFHFQDFATEVATITEGDTSAGDSAVAKNVRAGERSTVRDWIGLATGETPAETEAAKRNKAFVAAAHAGANGNGKRRKPKAE